MLNSYIILGFSGRLLASSDVFGCTAIVGVPFFQHPEGPASMQLWSYVRETCPAICMYTCKYIYIYIYTYICIYIDISYMFLLFICLFSRFTFTCTYTYAYKHPCVVFEAYISMLAL